MRQIELLNINMTNVTIEMPDERVRRQEGLAAAQHKTIQQLAIERLHSLFDVSAQYAAGSPAAVLKAMFEPPHLSSEDVDALEMAIAAGRLPMSSANIFPE